MLAIAINQELLDRRADIAGATDRQIEAARTSALRKMRKRIETTVKRRVATRERIPQRALEGRFFSNNVQPGDDELQVWIGTWSISPFAIGNPVQNARGVRAARKSYPGAFIASIYGGVNKVWIRLYSKHYDPNLYPTKYRPGDRGLGSNTGRFPVVRAAIPIDDTVKTVLEMESESIARDFEKVFLAELNYQVNVKGGTI